MAPSKPARRSIAKRKARAALPGKAARKVSAKAAGKAAHQVASKAPKRAAAAALSKVPAAVKGISAVVINLARRPDRWEKVQQSLARQAPWLEVRRLDAVDGAAKPPPKRDVASSWSTERLASLFPWYKTVTVTMSPGERGCCASHVAAWRLAAKGSRPLLVLEDDAVALPSFTPTLVQAVAEAPKDTGMIFLSSKDRGTRKQAGKVLMEPYFVWTTVGYVIYPAAAKTLLHMLPLDMPVDNFLGWHIREGRVRAFSVRPAAVRQAQTWNVGSDVPHSDDIAH